MGPCAVILQFLPDLRIDPTSIFRARHTAFFAGGGFQPITGKRFVTFQQSLWSWRRNPSEQQALIVYGIYVLNEKLQAVIDYGLLRAERKLLIDQICKNLPDNQHVDNLFYEFSKKTK